MRVHFAAIHDGRSGSPRRNHSTLIVDPAVEHRADALHVLHPAAGPRAGELGLKIRFLEEQAGGHGLDVRFHEVSFEEPGTAAALVGDVIRDYGDDSPHLFHYNIAPGPRESVVVGFLAAQYWPLELYNARVNLEEEPHPTTEEWRYDGSEDVPTPARTEVTPGARTCLTALAPTGRAKQRALIAVLVEAGMISDEGENRHQALHSRFQPYARQLEQNALAEKVGRGRNCEWRLTPTGGYAATILGCTPTQWGSVASPADAAL